MHIAICDDEKQDRQRIVDWLREILIGGIISNLNGRIYTHICAGSRSTFGLVSGQICGEQISAYIRSNF